MITFDRGGGSTSDDSDDDQGAGAVDTFENAWNDHTPDWGMGDPIGGDNDGHQDTTDAADRDDSDAIAGTGGQVTYGDVRGSTGSSSSSGSSSSGSRSSGSSSSSSTSSSSDDSSDPAETIEDRARSGDANPFTPQSDSTFDPRDPSTYDLDHTPTGEDSEVRLTEGGETAVVIDRSRDEESDVGPQPGDPRKGPALMTSADDASGGGQQEQPPAQPGPEAMPFWQRMMLMGQGGPPEGQDAQAGSGLPTDPVTLGLVALVVLAALYYGGGA